VAPTGAWPEADFDARCGSRQAILRPQVELTGTASVPVAAIRESPALARRFEAIVFDWDATAVPDRHTDAGRIRGLVEQACAHGLELAIVSGTHVDNVDGQLGARPAAGPGGLILAVGARWSSTMGFPGLM
jgi:hypothetical protein